jgi:hypothetical protein
VGGENVLNPALRLMTYYRLVIEEIEDPEVITSDPRWVDAVQVRGAQALKRRSVKIGPWGAMEHNAELGITFRCSQSPGKLESNRSL